MVYDQIHLQVCNSLIEDYKVVEVYINGFRFIDLVYNIEYPYSLLENREGMAGAYEGIPAIFALPPAQHFFGRPVKDYSYPEGKTALLEYAQSGIPGEWTLIARIKVADKTITWSEFEQVKRPRGNGQYWDYADLGEFNFERNQYTQALTKAALNAYD